MPEHEMYECDWCESTIIAKPHELTGRYGWLRKASRHPTHWELLLCDLCKHHAEKPKSKAAA